MNTDTKTDISHVAIRRIAAVLLASWALLAAGQEAVASVPTQCSADQEGAVYICEYTFNSSGSLDLDEVVTAIKDEQTNGADYEVTSIDYLVIGGGAEVSDLAIVSSVNDDAAENSGLLANVIQGQPGNPARVSNVSVDEDSRIDGGANDLIGGLAGTIQDANLADINIRGQVSGNNNVGGVAGALFDTEANDITIGASVSAGNSNVGALAGGGFGNTRFGNVIANEAILSVGGQPVSTQGQTLFGERFMRPVPPKNVRATPGVNSLVVSWVAPEDDGGTPIIRYQATVNPSCEVDAVDDEELGVTEYSCVISGLSPQQSYPVMVTAFNAAGGASAMAAAENGEALEFQPEGAVAIPVNSRWALWLMVLLMLLVVRRSVRLSSVS